MLCQDCNGNGHLTVPGRCSNCSKGTPSISLLLCDACSIQLAECAMCGVPIDVSSALPPLPVKPGTYFVKKNEKDKGGKTSLKPGEELHITLPAQRWGMDWSIRDYPWSCLSVKDRGQFTPDPGDYQNGTVTIIFTASSAGSGKIELEQSGKVAWTIDVKVK